MLQYDKMCFALVWIAWGVVSATVWTLIFSALGQIALPFWVVWNVIMCAFVLIALYNINWRESHRKELIIRFFHWVFATLATFAAFWLAASILVAAMLDSQGFTWGVLAGSPIAPPLAWLTMNLIYILNENRDREAFLSKS